MACREVIHVTTRVHHAARRRGGIWPLPARAQQPAKLPTMGFLGAATPATWSRLLAAFVRRLRELGWIEGRSIAIEYRWAEGRGERFAEIAAEFVRLKVDVIVTAGGVVLAAKQATSVIPIVFAVAADPSAAGRRKSRRGPAATSPACRFSLPILPASDLNSCARSCPVFRQLAIMANAGNPAAVLEMAEVQATARTLGLEVTHWKSGAPRISRRPLRRSRAARSALYVCGDPLATTNRVRINTLALAARLPTMYSIGSTSKRAA